MLGCDIPSRAIWDKEAEKASRNAWDLFFPGDSGHPLPPSTKAGETGSMVGGKEAVIRPSPQSVWEPGRDSHDLVCGRFPRVQRNLTSSARLNEDLLNSKDLEL